MIRKVDEESSSSSHSPWTRQGFGLQCVPIQQHGVMNGKAVLLEPSTNQSLITKAPTGVLLIYSPISSHGSVKGVSPYHNGFHSLSQRDGAS